MRIDPVMKTVKTEDPNNAEGITVITAENISETDKVGYIHIKKTLTDSEKCSEDYIKSLIFIFKIEVEGYETKIVALRPELKNGEWVWEYNGKYVWKAEDYPSNQTPAYTITEVDLPEGVTFEQVNTDDSTGVTGTGDKYVKGNLIENSVLEEEIILTESAFINKFATDYHGDLIIEKTVTDDYYALGNEEILFNVTFSSAGDFICKYGGKEYTPTNGSVTIEVSVKFEKDGDTVAKSSPIDVTWYGEVAPTYIVEEQESDVAKVVSMHNETGSVKKGTEVVATFKNDRKKVGGRFELEKEFVGVDGNISIDKVFHFDVTLTFYNSNKGKVEESTTTIRVDLKGGEKYTSDYYEWNASEKAPTYVVEEIDEPGFESDIENPSGSLSSEETVKVIAKNKPIDKTGTFKITKEIVPNKFIIDSAGEYTFSFRIRIDGTFKMKDEPIHYKENGYYEYEASITVPKGELEFDYTSPPITWWGEKAPTVTVEEIELPKGWKQVGSPSNNGASLKENEEIEIISTNELPAYPEIDLTIELAGKVWEDEKQEEGKNTLESRPNGQIDDGELAIQGVEVYVYRIALDSDNKEVHRMLANGCDDNLKATLTYPIITNSSGEWKAQGIELSAMTEEEKNAGGERVRFDVEFVYDGQTYEPTTFLAKEGYDSTGLAAYIEGKAEDYMEADLSERDEYWWNKSMAKETETEREEVNDRIQKINGNTSINGKGETIGTVSGNESENNVNYLADVSNTSSTSKLRSQLMTTDENGRVYDVFKAKASTLAGELSYPFDEHMHLESTNVTITDLGVKYEFKYSATYEYCLNINLGLVRRETVDAEATKDLVSAKVIVDGKEQEYIFNKLEDIIKRNSDQNFGNYQYEREIGYELGLYKTDYFYRAEMYKSNLELYSAMNDYYKNIFENTEYGAEDSELDVYLTYKLSLYNSSKNYTIKINEVADYYDSSFEGPINIDTKEMVDEKIENVIKPEKEVTKDSDIDNPNAYWKKQEKENPEELDSKYIDPEGSSPMEIEWKTVERNIHSSDGRTYNKMTLEPKDLELDSGERAEIYVTFKLRKDDINGIKDSIILGEKANIVEISSYSTFYSDRTKEDENGNEVLVNAGKIDMDSAPANANIEDYNERAWYEDDTDIAPSLKLYLKDEIREVNGIAWEDDKISENIATGNGVLDSEENVIGGLTTELIEKINVPVTDETGKIKRNAEGNVEEYTVYDFLWPTSESLNCLGGKTIESLTGFASTIETSRNLDDTVGTYSFKGVPLGQHVVRFLYGNDKTSLEDQTKVTKEPAQAFKIIREGDNVSVVKANDRINTSNYDGDKIKETIKTTDENGKEIEQEIPGATAAVYNGQDYKSTIYQATKDPENVNNNEENPKEDRDSDAKDSETKRLDAIANSQTITNTNGNVLQTANDIEKIHTELYNQYSMYADTDRLIFEIDKDTDSAVNELKSDSETNSEANGSSNDEDIGSEANESSNEMTTIYGKDVTEYIYEKVDFGLIERPENNIVLDKQINEIILKTNDGKVIFDAIYDIAYRVNDEKDENFDSNAKTIIKKLDDDKYLYADVTLNTEKSVGIDQLQAIDKNDIKPTNANYSGTQNFRFINVDSEILQGTTLSINYLITALNIGEPDYMNEDFAQVLSESVQDFDVNPDGTITSKAPTDPKKALTTKQKIQKLSTELKKLESKGIDVHEKYLGKFYYNGYELDKEKTKIQYDENGKAKIKGDEEGTDIIVTTKIRQLVDYVGNDAVFNSTENEENDHIWRNTNITELLGSGLEENRLIDPNVLPVFQKVDKHEVDYLVKQDVLTDPSDPSTLTGKSIQRDNLILSVDDDSEQTVITESETPPEETEDTPTVDTNSIVKSNAGFERELVPYDVVDLEEDFEYTSSITLTVSKTVAAQDDADNLSYDNIAEIVKYENSVGRRDEAALVGNANPLIGEFKTSLKERDASATELITFTPPTGIETQEVMQTQFLIIVISSLVIVVIGIVIIKKKVLK